MKANIVDCTTIRFHKDNNSRMAYRDKQHLIQLVTVGGLYVPREEVQAALAPEPGITKRILDLGEHSRFNFSQ